LVFGIQLRPAAAEEGEGSAEVIYRGVAQQRFPDAPPPI
jgi:hypothetical protein